MEGKAYIKKWQSDDGRITLYCGDCLDILKTLTGADAVVTDPPYFLPVTHYQTRRRFSRNFSDLGILEHFFKCAFALFAQVVVPTGTLYIFSDGQSYPLFYYHLYPFCKSVRPLIWDKKTSINGYGWRHQHEIIIFAEMPEARPVPTGDGDILRFSAAQIDEREHPAQKPVELLAALIDKSTQPKNAVLDPFMGSGTTGIACIRTGRKFIGIEISPEYYEIALHRIKKELATRAHVVEKRKKLFAKGKKCRIPKPQR